jgi:hypothetical protein
MREKGISKMSEEEKKPTEGDPLLKRGIGKDWVCVIPPQLVQNVLELANNTPEIISAELKAMMGIHYTTGRKTHVLPTLTDEIEYLSPEAFEHRYGEMVRVMEAVVKGKSNSSEGENEG